METVDDLQRELQRIDRKQYGTVQFRALQLIKLTLAAGAYKDLRGTTL